MIKNSKYKFFTFTNYLEKVNNKRSESGFPVTDTEQEFTDLKDIVNGHRLVHHSRLPNSLYSNDVISDDLELSDIDVDSINSYSYDILNNKEVKNEKNSEQNSQYNNSDNSMVEAQSSAD